MSSAWIQSVTPDNRVYFFNTITQEVQWADDSPAAPPPPPPSRVNNDDGELQRNLGSLLKSGRDHLKKTPKRGMMMGAPPPPPSRDMAPPPPPPSRGKTVSHGLRSVQPSQQYPSQSYVKPSQMRSGMNTQNPSYGNPGMNMMPQQGMHMRPQQAVPQQVALQQGAPQPGWMQIKGPDNQMFWYNSVTGESSYTDPIAPPQTTNANTTPFGTKLKSATRQRAATVDPPRSPRQATSLMAALQSEKSREPPPAEKIPMPKYSGATPEFLKVGLKKTKGDTSPNSHPTVSKMKITQTQKKEIHAKETHAKQPEQTDSPENWMEMTANDGKKSWYNQKTKEMVWEKPKCFVEKDLPPSPRKNIKKIADSNPTPVRARAATVSATPNRLANPSPKKSPGLNPNAASRSKSPQVLKSPHVPKSPSLQPKEEVVIPKIDTPKIDTPKTDAPPTENPSNADVQEEWKEATTPEGQVYYYNTKTMQVSWFIPEKTKTTQKLPPDWISVLTPDGKVYYHNPVLGVTQWEKPEEATQNQPASTQPASTQSTQDAVSKDLNQTQSSEQNAINNEVKEEWKPVLTPEGQVYYYNPKTMETTWNDPNPESAKLLPWVKISNDGESEYYYNVQTKESSNTLPASLSTSSSQSKIPVPPSLDIMNPNSDTSNSSQANSSSIPVPPVLSTTSSAKEKDTTRKSFSEPPGDTFIPENVPPVPDSIPTIPQNNNSKQSNDSKKSDDPYSALFAAFASAKIAAQAALEEEKKKSQSKAN